MGFISRDYSSKPRGGNMKVTSVVIDGVKFVPENNDVNKDKFPTAMGKGVQFYDTDSPYDSQDFETAGRNFAEALFKHGSCIHFNKGFFTYLQQRVQA